MIFETSVTRLPRMRSVITYEPLTEADGLSSGRIRPAVGEKMLLQAVKSSGFPSDADQISPTVIMVSVVKHS